MLEKNHYISENTINVIRNICNISFSNETCYNRHWLIMYVNAKSDVILVMKCIQLRQNTNELTVYVETVHKK